MHRTVLLSLLALACKGEPTPTVPVVDPVTFLETADAERVDVVLSGSMVDAHDALQSLHAMVGLYGFDIDVQDLLNVEPVPPAAELKCWTNSISGTTRVLSYDLCGTIIEGSVVFEQRNDQTRLVTNSPTFTYDGRRIAGGLVAAPTGEASPVFATSPADDAGAPADTLALAVGSRDVAIGLDAHLELDPVNGRAFFWGQASLDDTVVHIGGADASETSVDERPTAAVAHRMFDTCRCSVGGEFTYETTVELDTVVIDVSSALDGGGTIWPDLPVELNEPLEAVLTVRPSTVCGEWTGSFASVEPLLVDGDSLRAAVESGCTNNSFGSPEACQRVRLGAADVESLEISISERVSKELVEAVTDAQFENRFCDLVLD